MPADRLLDRDPTIHDLRDQIDDIDMSRATKMASWIVDTLINLDRIESGEMDRVEMSRHWEPYSTIDLLTRSRDRRTDLVGLRKKELEEQRGELIPTNQEGRWQRVKKNYLDAVEGECEVRGIDQELGYTALEWMHDYTEYEHARAKNRQTVRRGADETKPAEAGSLEAEELPKPAKTRHWFPHLSHPGRDQNHRRSA